MENTRDFYLNFVICNFSSPKPQTIYIWTKIFILTVPERETCHCASIAVWPDSSPPRWGSGSGSVIDALPLSYACPSWSEQHSHYMINMSSQHTDNKGISPYFTNQETYVYRNVYVLLVILCHCIQIIFTSSYYFTYIHKNGW